MFDGQFPDQRLTLRLLGCCRWIDLFRSFPSLGKKLPIEVFLQLIPLMHARYYSIASSSAVEQNQVTIDILYCICSYS